MKNVLFVSAHPDDHITSAGFLNKLRQNGYFLYEILLTDGSGGYINESEKGKIVSIRRKEFEKASKFLCTREIHCLGYDEHSLLMNKENVETLVELIRKISPQIVIIPSFDDYHETHIEANKICKKAIRTAMEKRKLELGRPVDIFMVLEWEYSVSKHPDIVVDITREWNFKKKLCRCYPSQINSSELRKLAGLNMYRGSMIGTEYGEGFKVSKFLPIKIDKIIL